MATLDYEIAGLFHVTGPYRSTPSCPIKLDYDFNPSSGVPFYSLSDSNCSKVASYNMPFFLAKPGPRYEAVTMAAHEGRPGHHTQVRSASIKLKPRPNDRNSSTQYIATLLTQYLQALAKRSQHFDATYRNIVGRNMLRAFGHRVATRCGMLRVKIKQCACPGATLLHEPGQTTTTSCNIHKCWVKNLPFSNLSPQHPTCRKTSQCAASW